MSGVGYGTEPWVPPDPRAHPEGLKKPPPEEHSLVIIGYDDDTFVFADPDAAVSHTPEAGFGVLFFNSIEHRLGTAIARSFLYVTPDGKHDFGGGNKRYQVISLSSFEESRSAPTDGHPSRVRQ